VYSMNVLPQSDMVRVLVDIPVTVADICDVPGGMLTYIWEACAGGSKS
jgi:hypothetical protein